MFGMFGLVITTLAIAPQDGDKVDRVMNAHIAVMRHRKTSTAIEAEWIKAPK